MKERKSEVTKRVTIGCILGTQAKRSMTAQTLDFSALAADGTSCPVHILLA